MNRLALVLLACCALVAAASSAEIHLRTHQFDPLVSEPQIDPSLRAEEPSAGQLGYYLVQLEGPVTDEHKAALTTRGVEIIGYIPEFAFLVVMTPEASRDLRAASGIRWVGMYHPAYKLDPTLGTQTYHHPDRVNDPWLWLVVHVYDHANEDAVAARLEELGGEVQDVVHQGNKRILVRMPPELLRDVARIPEVLFVLEQGEYYVHNNTTRWVVQSNVSGNTSIWSHGLHGENQLIAEMDSGVDWQSCFFRDPEGDPIGSNHRKIQNYSTYGSGVAYDGCTNGHGSHVAGTLLGNDFTGANSAYNGMAYEARLVVQDIGRDNTVDCNQGYIYPPSSLTTAFTNAYSLGARIHTNSWGGPTNQYDSYCQDIDSFMWSNRDFLVLFAMGNAGPSASTIGYPATAKNCVSVGGCQQANTQHNMYYYSSRGPCYDNRRKPDVVAPACGDDGTAPHIFSCDNDPSSSPTCAVTGQIWEGTSMATPAVAGCAALIRQYFLSGYHPTGTPNPADAFSPSAALVKAMLVASGQRMTGTGISGYPDNNQGFGRVLLENVLFFTGDDVGLDVVDHTTGLSTGGTYTRQVVIGAGQPVRFVLVWTDPPKTPPANPALVNDLNLTVTDPGGNTYLGNVFSGGQSVPGGSADGLNNVEVVHRDSPTTGIWTIQVTGANVPTGPQPFALVTRGAGLNVPVALSSFEASYRAEDRSVLLEWTTASEQDNLGFYVERTSALGAPYRRLNAEPIPGAGTSSVPHTYRFVDRDVEPGTYYYRLIQVDTNGTMASHGPLTVLVEAPVPTEFFLGPAVPNPFDESVTIRYGIPSRTDVIMGIYDLQGRLIRVLVDRTQDPATHAAQWDGRDLAGTPAPAGQYVCRLMTDSYVATSLLVLVR